VRILRGEDLKPCNSLSLLARASALVNVHDSRDLPRACKWARERGLDVVALGQGSNVVLAGDLEALVLRLQTRGMEILEDRGDTVLLRVAAGEDWHGLVQWTLQHGFHGLEPGTDTGHGGRRSHPEYRRLRGGTGVLCREGTRAGNLQW
jgi:UDP-N-acetylmuramate dehydrogenase